MVGNPEVEMTEIVEIEMGTGDGAVVPMGTIGLVGGVPGVADIDTYYSCTISFMFR
jgi:hypothetical protein